SWSLPREGLRYGADLCGADLSGSNLSGALFGVSIQSTGSNGLGHDATTQWPQGFRPPSPPAPPAPPAPPPPPPAAASTGCLLVFLILPALLLAVLIGP